MASLGMERAGRCGLAAARVEERSWASARVVSAMARAALAGLNGPACLKKGGRAGYVDGGRISGLGVAKALGLFS